MRVRQLVNLLNLSTPLGALVAVLGGARLRPGPDGLILAEGYRARFPGAGARAVTIGNVVLLRMHVRTATARPGLLAHESRHASQYALWLGLFGFLPAYLLASAWSTAAMCAHRPPTRPTRRPRREQACAQGVKSLLITTAIPCAVLIVFSFTVPAPNAFTTARAVANCPASP